MSLKITSETFGDGKPIPVKYTADGSDVSPPLHFAGVPKQSAELALIVDDPDAPRAEPFVHWVIYKIPADVTDLPEGVPRDPTLKNPPGALQGKNDFGKVGYGGPSPPRGHGTHHYHFHLYALDTALEAKSGLDKKALLASMSSHILDEGELVGTYERK